MAYSTTNPLALMSEGYSDDLPRMWFWQSTHASTDFALRSSTLGSSADVGVGFFTGIGQGSRGLTGLGVRLGDVMLHVSQANQGTTDIPIYGITTLHSVIDSTPNCSTTLSSVGFDVTVSQASL